MAAISTISLHIYGGAQGSDFGASPLVSVGSLPDGFSPTVPTLVSEERSWMIVHAQEYTLYAFYSKRCLTSDSQHGQVEVCLFLPPKQRLAEGYSPLDVLESATNLFAVQMTNGNKLPASPVDSAPFKMLVGRFALEERPRVLPVMSGSNPAALCLKDRSQLNAVMRYSYYNQLISVGLLELGYHCKSTISLGETTQRKDKKAEPEKEPEKVEEPMPKAAEAKPSQPEVKPSQSEVKPETAVSPASSVPKPRRSHRKRKVGVVALLLGVAAIAAFVFYLSAPQNKKVTEPEHVAIVSKPDTTSLEAAQQQAEDSEKVAMNQGKPLSHADSVKAKEAVEEAVKKSKGKEIPKGVNPKEQQRLKNAYQILEAEYHHAYLRLNRWGRTRLRGIEIPPLSEIKDIGEIYVLHNRIRRLLADPDNLKIKRDNEMRQIEKNPNADEVLNMASKIKKRHIKKHK